MADSTLDKKFDVVVVGSIFMDLICYSGRLPKPGETLEGTDFQAGYGGKGANQAVAAQRLGAKTVFVGKVGRDAYGNQYYENFKSEGVNVDGIKFEENAPTGVASIMVGNDTGDNFIVIVKGATGKVSPEYVAETGEELIAQSKVLVCQLEISTEATIAALRLAKKYGVTTIFNAAPGLAGLPKELFQLTDILCINETETELICGLEKVASLSDVEKAVEILKEKFECKDVIITLGADGAIYWDHKLEKLQQFPAPRVKAVDSTGAGDSFIGTLAFGVANGQDLPSAIKQSILNASQSVLRKGTQSSFPHSLVQSPA